MSLSRRVPRALAAEELAALRTLTPTYRVWKGERDFLDEFERRGLAASDRRKTGRGGVFQTYAKLSDVGVAFLAMLDGTKPGDLPK